MVYTFFSSVLNDFLHYIKKTRTVSEELQFPMHLDGSHLTVRSMSRRNSANAMDLLSSGQSALPVGASIETLQALAHNINFTVAKLRLASSSKRLQEEESGKRPKHADFGRGYAMEYFMSLRRYPGRVRSKQRVLRKVATESGMSYLY